MLIVFSTLPLKKKNKNKNRVAFFHFGVLI